MDIVAAYNDVGSYRGAAAICGVDHKTAKRALERTAARSRGRATRRAPRGHNYDTVAEVVKARVEATKGRITAKRLLREARVAGYAGSARNFRRAVASAKASWRAGEHRGRRPGSWAPGEVLVIDWGTEAGLHIFCAVMAHSRWRFVRFVADEKAQTTMALLAECFTELGGVPKVVLADRMGCLKTAVVANLVVPTPAYVRFASHYGFRPDFCEAHDPESKGIVENLVGYAKSDLVVPLGLSAGDLAGANEEARAWCAEVNARLHSEISAVPAQRLEAERALLGPLPTLAPNFGRAVTRKVDRLSCVRLGGARYSVPMRLIGAEVSVEAVSGGVRISHLGELVAAHCLAAPGEARIDDAHYGGPRRAPERRPRPRSGPEKAICALGEVGEAFIKAAAAAGVGRLSSELAAIAELEGSHGRAALVGALERAVAFGRFRAADVASILAAGKGVAQPVAPGQALVIELPAVPRRALADYAEAR